MSIHKLPIVLHKQVNHIKEVMKPNYSSNLVHHHTTSKEVGNQPNKISQMCNNINCRGIKTPASACTYIYALKQLVVDNKYVGRE